VCQDDDDECDEIIADQSVNPVTEKIRESFEELTDKQLETAHEAAAIGFGTWRDKSFEERATVVAGAAAMMRARVDAFVGRLTFEMGEFMDELSVSNSHS
jgi:succinate-semialdehyde dehydrogenase/glutarate-semialdehyde dehydrogenase